MEPYYLKGEHLLFVEAPAELREMGNAMKQELAELKDGNLKNNNVMIGLLAKNNQLNDELKLQQKQIDTGSQRSAEV